MNLDQAEEFVKKKHGNQKRMQGTPYYLHPFAVANILLKQRNGIWVWQNPHLLKKK